MRYLPFFLGPHWGIWKIYGNHPISASETVETYGEKNGRPTGQTPLAAMGVGEAP
jgi:hypothetical protein